MVFEDWIERANKLLTDNFGISLSDAGTDEEHLRRCWSDGDTPETFMEWYAEKYDLVPASEACLAGAVVPSPSEVTEPVDQDSLLRECLAALNTARAFSYQFGSERRSSYSLAARVEKAFRENSVDPYSMR